MSPLVTSFLMLLALMPIMGWTVNYFNMLFFPAMLGIGIDSSIHVYHRYLEEGDSALPSIVSHTGAGIGVASLTTSLGFGGMILASHLGLQSLGLLAIAGLTITLVNSVFIFPCLLRILYHHGWLPVEPGIREANH
jgi:predicted RND superfamily exporter protein